MSAKQSLLSAQPDFDFNGLVKMAQTFVDSRDDEEFTVVARIKCRATETNRENGDVTAKMGFTHIEVVTGMDEAAVASMLKEEASKRTGVKPLGEDDAWLRGRVDQDGEIR